MLTDRMPTHMQCTVSGCTRRDEHSTAAHHCDVCGERGGHHGALCAPLRITCPMCRQTTDAELRNLVYTNGSCSICMEPNPMVLFGCRHACVCQACVRQLV